MPPTCVFLGMEEPMSMRTTIPNSKYSSILHQSPPCYIHFNPVFTTTGSQRCLNSSLAPWAIPALANWAVQRHLTVRTTKPWLRPVPVNIGMLFWSLHVLTFGSIPKHETVIFGLIPPHLNVVFVFHKSRRDSLRLFGALLKRFKSEKKYEVRSKIMNFTMFQPFQQVSIQKNKMKPTNPNADTNVNRQKQHLSHFLDTLMGHLYLTHRLVLLRHTLMGPPDLTLLHDTVIRHSYLTLL